MCKDFGYFGEGIEGYMHYMQAFEATTNDSDGDKFDDESFDESDEFDDETDEFDDELDDFDDFGSDE